jgi:hypothetical protein
MILAHFRPAPAVYRPYTVEMVQRITRILEDGENMVLAAHIIETEQFSGKNRDAGLRAVRLRRLILLGLAVAMALATLAPAVVLAG